MKNEYRIVAAIDNADSVVDALKNLPHEISNQKVGLTEVKVNLAKYDFLYLRLVLSAEQVRIFDKEDVSVYGNLCFATPRKT